MLEDVCRSVLLCFTRHGVGVNDTAIPQIRHRAPVALLSAITCQPVLDRKLGKKWAVDEHLELPLSRRGEVNIYVRTDLSADVCPSRKGPGHQRITHGEKKRTTETQKDQISERREERGRKRSPSHERRLCRPRRRTPRAIGHAKSGPFHSPDRAQRNVPNSRCPLLAMF